MRSPIPTITYEQFIQQPNWIDILYINYRTGQPPLTVPDPTFNTLDNDTDHFTITINPILYLKRLPEPARDHLTRALILRIKSQEYVYHYTRDVIGERWPEAEEIIRQTPDWAYMYAIYVIQGRWPEAEEIINQNQHYAYMYTQYVIGRRQLEVEETIK